MAAINLGLSVIHRCVNTLSLSLVNVLSAYTNEWFTPLEGLYVAGLAFILVRFVLNGKTIHLRLLNRVCLLFCNQRARLLFSADQESLMCMFSNLLLAVSLAMLLVLMGESGPGGDLRGIFEGMLYLYGDVMDFTFKFGVFKVTLSAFMFGFVLDSFAEPVDPVYLFCIRMFKIICANLTSQGLDMLVESTPQLELFECLACVSVLRLLLPSMGSYFVFMAAKRMYVLYPGLAPMLFFSVIWLDFLPVMSRGWIGELCCIYVVTSIASYLFLIPTGGVVVVLVLTHYLDFALTTEFT
jgi:hypothetical protein